MERNDFARKAAGIGYKLTNKAEEAAEGCYGNARWFEQLSILVMGVAVMVDNVLVVRPLLGS